MCVCLLGGWGGGCLDLLRGDTGPGSEELFFILTRVRLVDVLLHPPLELLRCRLVSLVSSLPVFQALLHPPLGQIVPIDLLHVYTGSSYSHTHTYRICTFICR
jgi:hypothetical protein